MQQCPKCSTWSPADYSACGKCGLDFTVPYTPRKFPYKSLFVLLGLGLIALAGLFAFNKFRPTRYEKPTIGMTYENFVQVCPFRPYQSNLVETADGSKLRLLIRADDEAVKTGCHGIYFFENGYLTVIEKN